MFSLEHFTVSSSKNPPLTTIILFDGQHAISSPDRKFARSALLSSRAMKFDHDFGISI